MIGTWIAISPTRFHFDDGGSTGKPVAPMPAMNLSPQLWSLAAFDNQSQL
jgi:hypothetical protein